MIAQLTNLSASAEPTAFHHLLKTLDERGQLLRLYTQNIDNLEEKAGLECGVPIWAGQAGASSSSQSGTTINGSVAPTKTTGSSSIASSSVPRCVPLHGTLKQLVCQRCSHTMPLLAPLSSAPEGATPSSNEHALPNSVMVTSPDTDLTTPELETLAAGLSIACPACESASFARRAEGKRDRGVGRMRPSVVLYGEEHLSGEGVGEWYVASLSIPSSWLLTT